MVISQQGIAATSQPLASQASAQILARGGSAADAAIAANAVLGVVEPMMNGMGGDLFVVYRDGKTGSLTGLNASGPAPRALSRDFLAARGATAMPATGIHTVTVPGAVDGWAKMHGRFGKLPWSTLFEPASPTRNAAFPFRVVRELWAAPEAGQSCKLPGTAASTCRATNRRTGDVFRNCVWRLHIMVAEGAAAVIRRLAPRS
jgi:gamma-glutamyltranspeptidase/glutathione hydrolase